MADLRGHIARVLGSVVGITALGCAGKAEEEGSGRLTPTEREADLRDDLTNDFCTEGEGVPSIAQINPAQPQDYIAYRRMDSSVTYAQEQVESSLPTAEELNGLTPAEQDELLTQIYGLYVSVESETGTCDPNAGCTNNVLPPTDGFWDFDFHYHYMAYGNGVFTFAVDVESMRGLLGPIDTPADAFTLARADGYRVDCGGMNYRVVDGGYEIYVETGQTCGGDITGHLLRVSTGGWLEEVRSEIVEKGDSGCQIGRFPAGTVHLSRTTATHPVAAYFARVGQLEASSVFAFEELARDLHHHGAPTRLVDWARRAAREEANHARLCFALCRRYGGNPSAPRVERRGVQTLFQIALDNAVEGLTREAFGAVLAHHQAARSRDPVIARAMHLIAEDETGHAEFSLELHEWLGTRLSATERDTVSAAHASAIVRFERDAHPARDAETNLTLGLPNVDASRQLFRAFFEVEPGAADDSIS